MAKREGLDEAVSQALDEVPPEQRNPKIERHARRTEAVSMALAGFTYEQIGDRLNLSPRGAHQLVTRTLEESRNYAVDDLRRVENARLDRAQAAIWTEVIGGDLKAISTFLRISERRAKLNGLDAPSKIAMAVEIKQEMEQQLQVLEAVVLESGSRQDEQDIVDAEEQKALSADYIIDPVEAESGDDERASA